MKDCNIVASELTKSNETWNDTMQMITNSRVSTRSSKIITTITLWSLNLVAMQSHSKRANKSASKEFEAFERYVLNLLLNLES